MNNAPARALLAIEPPDLAAMQRMPPVVDDDFLPDMGRMFGDWRSDGPTGCSRARCVLASVRLPS